MWKWTHSNMHVPFGSPATTSNHFTELRSITIPKKTAKKREHNLGVLIPCQEAVATACTKLLYPITGRLLTIIVTLH